MAAVEQAQDQVAGQIHAAASQASAALNKLAQLLQSGGVDQETVKRVDEMANEANSLASAAVGNVPDEETPETSPGTQPAGGIGRATEEFARELNPAGYAPA